MKTIITKEIPSSNAINVFRGFQYAEYTGYSINKHVSISWMQRTDYPRNESSKEMSLFAIERTDHFKRCFSDFARYYKFPNLLAYVHENDPYNLVGHMKKNVHTHIGLHVPENMSSLFFDRAKEWANHGNSKKIHHCLIRITPPPHWVTCRYILKGTELSARLHQPDGSRPLFRDVLEQLAPNVAVRPDQWDQGPIYGKRCGLSKQLDRTARDRAGFIPPSITVDQPTSPEELAGMYQQLRYAAHVLADAA